MRKVVIADTSCLIILHKISEIDLLRKVYDQVFITPEVAEEFNHSLPVWIQVVQDFDKQYQALLELEIDKGEASSIALALKVGKVTLILDDLKGRKVAEKLGLVYTGTFGVIAKAKIEGVIDSVKPIIAKIRSTNFRISEKVIAETLKEAGEN